MNMVSDMKRLWAIFAAGILFTFAGCAVIDKLYTPQFGRVTVTADNVTITPKENFLFSQQWEKTGWLFADGLSLFQDSEHLVLKEMEKEPLLLEFTDGIAVNVTGSRASSYTVYDLSYSELSANKQLEEGVIRDLPDTAKPFFISLRVSWSAILKSPGAESANSACCEYVFMAQRKPK